MGSYLSDIKKVFTFDGDRVEVTLSRISFEDAMAMRDFDGNKSAQTVRKYVKSIEGVKDANGIPVSVDTIFTEFYFSSLVLNIVTAALETGKLVEPVPFGER